MRLAISCSLNCRRCSLSQISRDRRMSSRSFRPFEVRRTRVTRPSWASGARSMRPRASSRLRDRLTDGGVTFSLSASSLAVAGSLRPIVNSRLVRAYESSSSVCCRNTRPSRPRVMRSFVSSGWGIGALSFFRRTAVAMSMVPFHEFPVDIVDRVGSSHRNRQSQPMLDAGGKDPPRSSPYRMTDSCHCSPSIPQRGPCVNRRALCSAQYPYCQERLHVRNLGRPTAFRGPQVNFERPGFLPT
ncbi:unannotated protein [freshwater metagenome]|uniref:Unannotated protein n=1 Tax=freshwater metagenome TaxID=449393 RepID=A0A6J7KEZ7_9ZZZZ